MKTSDTEDFKEPTTIGPSKHRELAASAADKQIADQIYHTFAATKRTEPDTMAKLKYKEAILFTVCYIADEIKRSNEPSPITNPNHQPR